MSEEQEQLSQEPVEESTETPQPDPLEQVYQEYNVDEAAQQFTAQPAQETVQQPQFDPYVDYEEQQRQEQAALVGQISSAVSEVNQIKSQLAQQAVEADIGKAVENISKQVDGVDPAVIEAHLHAQATKDAKFKQLWDNRQANPKAWERGVEAMGKKMADIFTVKQDPQLTENQRAAKQSQQTMAATNTPQSDDWSGLSNEEIDRRIAAIERNA